MQWHPIFAHLLRPLLQGFYDVLTEVPVGDLPRDADLLLVRQTAPAPFVGVWRHLSPWNVLEFKGPTDDPALRDLDLLVEVGLGIDRRLHEQRQRDGQPSLERAEVPRILGGGRAHESETWHCTVAGPAAFHRIDGPRAGN